MSFHIFCPVANNQTNGTAVPRNNRRRSMTSRLVADDFRGLSQAVDSGFLPEALRPVRVFQDMSEDLIQESLQELAREYPQYQWGAFTVTLTASIQNESVLFQKINENGELLTVAATPETSQQQELVDREPERVQPGAPRITDLLNSIGTRPVPSSWTTWEINDLDNTEVTTHQDDEEGW